MELKELKEMKETIRKFQSCELSSHIESTGPVKVCKDEKVNFMPFAGAKERMYAIELIYMMKNGMCRKIDKVKFRGSIFGMEEFAQRILAQ